MYNPNQEYTIHLHPFSIIIQSLYWSIFIAIPLAVFSYFNITYFSIPGMISIYLIISSGIIYLTYKKNKRSILKITHDWLVCTFFSIQWFKEREIPFSEIREVKWKSWYSKLFWDFWTLTILHKNNLSTYSIKYIIRVQKTYSIIAERIKHL